MSKATVIKEAAGLAEEVAGAAASALKPGAERLLEAVHALRPPVPARLVESAISAPQGPLDKLLARAKETHSDSLLVMKDGEVLLDWNASGESKAVQTNSITKSLTGLAIGKLVTENKLSLDEKVSTFFCDWLAGPKQEVTVRNLLNHTSGLPREGEPPGLESALAAELTTDPGTNFEYSNAGVDILAGIVKSITNKPIDKYVADEFLTPMGIKDFSWTHDVHGNAFGSKGLVAKSHDLAKVGQMLLDDGSFGGKALVDSKWIADSTKPSQPFKQNAGNLFWLENARFKADSSGQSVFVGADGFSARGYNGQFLTIFPKERIIGVRQIDKANYSGTKDEFTDFPRLLKKVADK
jgi:CubicO group peptidase (beta-lactamase class C family)